MIRDEAQIKAERDRRIQEFRAEIRARIPDPSKGSGMSAKNKRDPPYDSLGRKTYSANGGG